MHEDLPCLKLNKRPENPLKNLLQNKDKLYEMIGGILLIAFAIFLLIRASLGPMWYAEIDSNALPIISLQYRGSIVMNESDLVRAQTDFPTFYAGINCFDDLRSAKLIQTPSGWLSYYFPIYPLFCMPIKLLFAACRVNQERCFFVTNALLITIALWFVHKKLKVSSKQRLIALVLLMLSPIVYYNNYLCYEAFIFSMLTISLVQYYNKNYKLSAFLLALAGMSNSAVMAVGIVMVLEHFIKIFYFGGQKLFAQIVKENFKSTVKYGICFVPCLAPFFTQQYYCGNNIFLGSSNLQDFGFRFLTYLFDPTLGFFTFSAIGLIMFFGLSIVAICRKDLRALPWLAFLLGTVAAFALMFHINCGMIFCARYLVWTYPIIPIFLATVGFDVLHSVLWRRIIYSVAAISSGLLLFINHPTAQSSLYFNPVTQWILENVPIFYSPYSATFYSRTLHIDGAYNCTQVAYYQSPKTGEVRKLIFKAEPDQAQLVS